MRENRIKVDFNEFNRETEKSLKQGYMTERLGLLAMNMIKPTVKSYAKKKGVPIITSEEIIGNVLLKFCKKYLSKVTTDKAPYAFAIVMIRNLMIDEFRRLNRCDSLLGLSNTKVNGKTVNSTIIYFDDLTNND